MLVQKKRRKAISKLCTKHRPQSNNAVVKVIWAIAPQNIGNIEVFTVVALYFNTTPQRFDNEIHGYAQ